MVLFSYASDSDAARICQQGAKARERSDRAGFPPPTVGRFVKIRVWKRHFLAHEMPLLGVVYVVAYSTNSLLVESIYSLTPKKLLQKVFQRFSVVFDVLNNILKI